jgi:hypothetical protein
VESADGTGATGWCYAQQWLLQRGAARALPFLRKTQRTPSSLRPNKAACWLSRAPSKVQAAVPAVITTNTTRHCQHAARSTQHASVAVAVASPVSQQQQQHTSHQHSRTSGMSCEGTKAVGGGATNATRWTQSTEVLGLGGETQPAPPRSISSPRSQVWAGAPRSDLIY